MKQEIITLCLTLPLIGSSVLAAPGPAEVNAARSIQAAYNSGTGRTVSLIWPTAWKYDASKSHSRRSLQKLTLYGSIAQVVSEQKDFDEGTDRKTGRHHTRQSTELYADTWKKTPHGWALKRSRVVSAGSVLEDGKPLDNIN